MPKRKPSPVQLPERLDEVQLSARRTVRPGDVIHVSGVRGEFTVKWIDLDGTLAVWGGTSNRKKMRAFPLDRVTSCKTPRGGDA